MVLVSILFETLNINIFEEKTNYESYTDDSLKNRSYNSSLMGSAWIQTSGLNLNITFQNSSSNWLSLSKAETIAIFTALLIVLKLRKVKIFIDS